MVQLMVKNLQLMPEVRDLGLIPGLGSSLAVGDGQLIPSFFPGKFHGRETWAGCSLGL